ncbi:extracellular solute-binding protein [Aneurinibacillus terranovensis]|uniref:extracellular solute-binding protein n=1 Tax=Aneurinibacillus terranovensis TaxID=278991 RepID=UPI00048580AE|nr:extracellular solute-binding protein [Aneurinibacillus terranovensis]
MYPRKWISGILVSVFFLTGCSTSQSTQIKEMNRGSLPVIKVIGDSEQALAAFRIQEPSIQKKFGVRLEYHYPQRLSDNLEDFLFASHDSYDIYVLFPAKIPQYVERNMLLPLDRFTAHDPTLNDVMPIYRKLYMNYANHDYGMVYDGDAHLLFYRKDIFDRFKDEYRQKYGQDLRPPRTWKEYDRIARFLTRDLDGDGKIDIYGTASFGGDAKRYIWFAERYLSMGGRYFDEKMNPLIDQPKGVQALKDWINLKDSGATPPEAMYDWIDLNNAFLHGKTAMVVQWSDTSRFSFDKAHWGSQIEGKVGWTLVPGENPGSPRGGVWIGRVLAISSQSKQPDKAWQIIQYLTSPEISKQAVTSLDTINDPYRQSHFTIQGKGAFPSAEINRDFLATVKQSLLNTNADLMIPGGWEYMQVLDRNIGLALIHKLSPEQALRSTVAEWNKITDKYGRAEQEKHYERWLRCLEEVRQK